ncbi:blue copper oxidase CueO [Filimonas sp.]|nr:blue copper oxidase CueO [Filimonas sp.]
MNLMNRLSTLFILCLFVSAQSIKAQYNTMWIPDTLSGTNFNLDIKDTFAQIVNTGNQTITAGINGKFWGPTLFFNQGDTVHMNIHNFLNDSTTLHWHGFHLPAVMDGGPHQVIPPGTIWQPYWKVTNNAATYWYHPHLHTMTEEQITKGLGGLIIVRDPIESALALPRKYGVDDIPVVLTDRDFNTSNQFTVVPYGDSMLTNGTLRAQYTVPAQVVRFRILNGAIERSYNLGFSDNRSFYVITSDGGLLNAPVALTRYLLHAGERVEILVNCSGQSGTTVDLKAFNSTLGNFVAGGENFPNGPFANALGKIDFNILHVNIGPANGSPILSIPSTLTNNTLLNAASANITRKLTISDSLASLIPGVTILGPNAFIINHKLFDIHFNEYEVPLGNTEIWEITSSSVFGHPFHIHDVEFNILSVNGVAPVAAQAGWKDVVFIPGATGGPGGSTPSVVKFIANFDDYADSLHPFMFHCHIALHEDEGMMGQFIVTNKATGLQEIHCKDRNFRYSPIRLMIKYLFHLQMRVHKPTMCVSRMLSVEPSICCLVQN